MHYSDVFVSLGRSCLHHTTTEQPASQHVQFAVQAKKWHRKCHHLIFFLRFSMILVLTWNDLSKLPPTRKKTKNLEMISNNPHHWIPSTTKKLSVIKPMPAIAEAIIMQATWLKPFTFGFQHPFGYLQQLVVKRASPPLKEHIRNQQEKSPLAKSSNNGNGKDMRSAGHNHQLTGWQKKSQNIGGAIWPT